LRTDVGGFYRYDPAGDRWIPITDHFTRHQRNYYGGEGLALDPNDPNIVYIACGRQTAAWAGKVALCKSTDRGATWSKVPLEVPMGGNDDYRWAGPRLVVAPADSRTLFFASRKDGLFRSTDAGASWASVNLDARFRDNIGV